MSGWDVFQQIQAHPEYQKIPLVLMSGKKEEVTSKISEPFEFFEFIEKPFDRVVLAEAIRIAMTKARKARPRVAELPGSTVQLSESTLNHDNLSEFQAQLAEVHDRIAKIEATTGTEIQELRSQLLAADRSRQTEIASLVAKFEAAEQIKSTEGQVISQRVLQLETEVDTLKKQLGQLIVLIKKKLT
jgi:DNA-binding response OmpR family regulator